jgi:quinol monooxygenase YgiN
MSTHQPDDQSNGHHFVVVTFSTQPGSQDQALNEIGDYVAGFLSQQPGFITSRLFASGDGSNIVHQAEWTDEAAFKAVGPLARKHPDFPKLMAYEPKGIGYHLHRSF